MAKTTRKKQQPASEETQPAESTGTFIISGQDGVLTVPAELAEGLRNTHLNIDNKPEQNDAGQQPAESFTSSQKNEPTTVTIAPVAQPPVTLEVVQAKFKLELTKLDYEAGLQAITSYTITEENMAEAQTKLTAARKLLRCFDDIKDAFKKPVLERGRMIDSAYNSLKQPLEAEIIKKQNDLNKIAAEQARKQQEADREKTRIANIKKDIDDTLMSHSQTIALAKTTDTLIVLEKLLGSQKANKARFMEFLPDFVTRAGELTPLIKDKKEAIKELERIATEQAEAEKSGDDGKFIELEAQKEQVTARIEETQIVAQETAINQATAVSTVETGKQYFTTVKARRSAWKAELPTNQKDLDKAFKAGLLSVELDKDKIKTLISTLEDTGQLKDVEEITVNGVRLYLEKLY